MREETIYMKTRILQSMAVTGLLLVPGLRLQAEEWKRVDVGSYSVYAPASWNTQVGAAPGSVVVASTNPDGVVLFFKTEPNQYPAGRLPDIYQIWDVFRKTAPLLRCQISGDPDTDGRGMAGVEAIGAYKPCQNSGDEMRVKVAAMPGGRELLVAAIKYPGSLAFDSEAYRYGILDSVVLTKAGSQGPRPGTYTLAGGIGGSAKGPEYMSHGTIEILAGQRYRMGVSEAIGTMVNARAVSGETGKYVADGEDLILFSDAAPNWPVHDKMNQAPRRIRIIR
jgi:hypothetical protein